MRHLRRLIDEDWIVVLACGLALGYTALGVAQALGEMIARALPRANETFGEDEGFLAFRLGRHVVELAGVVSSLVAFVTVVAASAVVLALVHRREGEQAQAAS